MTSYPSSVVTLAKRPSGFVPIVLSFGALALVLGTIGIYGLDRSRQADEGAAAHIFQLLVVCEVPVLAFFAARWLRKDLLAGFTMLALQAAALGMALVPVWYFRL